MLIGHESDIILITYQAEMSSEYYNPNSGSSEYRYDGLVPFLGYIEPAD